MLVHTYSQAKSALQPEEKQLIEKQHASYYLKYVQSLPVVLHTEKHAAVWARLELERANVLRAWHWAVIMQELELVKASALAFSDIWSGQRQEGAKTLSQAITRFSEVKLSGHPVLAYLTIIHAEQLGLEVLDAEVIGEQLTQGLAYLDLEQDTRAVVRALRMLAICESAKGHFSRGKDIFEKALSIARDHDFVREISALLCNLGLALRDCSVPEETLNSYMRAAFKELQDLGHIHSLAYLLLVYGAHHIYQGRFEEGEGLLKQSLEIATSLSGDPTLIPYILIDLSRSAFNRNAYDEAESLALKVLKQSELKDLSAYTTALYLLGRLATARAAYKEARIYLLQSVNIAWQDHKWLVLSGALIYIAELECAEGKAELALCYLSCVLQQEAVINRDRVIAKRLVAQLLSKLSAEEAAQAQAKGSAMTLKDLVTEVLEHNLKPEDLLLPRNASLGQDESL